MKKFKLILLVGLALTFCGPSESEIEEFVVVEQVTVTEDVDKDCGGCGISSKYKYKMKFKTYSGYSYYYSDYKHEAGDTLLSSKMFIQQEMEDRANLILEVKELNRVNDSLVEANNTMSFQYDLMVSFYEKSIINKEKVD